MCSHTGLHHPQPQPGPCVVDGQGQAQGPECLHGLAGMQQLQPPVVGQLVAPVSLHHPWPCLCLDRLPAQSIVELKCLVEVEGRHAVFLHLEVYDGQVVVVEHRHCRVTLQGGAAVEQLDGLAVVLPQKLKVALDEQPRTLLTASVEAGLDLALAQLHGPGDQVQPSLVQVQLEPQHLQLVVFTVCASILLLLPGVPLLLPRHHNLFQPCQHPHSPLWLSQVEACLQQQEANLSRQWVIGCLHISKQVVKDACSLQVLAAGKSNQCAVVCPHKAVVCLPLSGLLLGPVYECVELRLHCHCVSIASTVLGQGKVVLHLVILGPLLAQLDEHVHTLLVFLLLVKAIGLPRQLPVRLRHIHLSSSTCTWYLQATTPSVLVSIERKKKIRVPWPLKPSCLCLGTSQVRKWVDAKQLCLNRL
eukprot:comp23199_c0_seq1/m.37685 comp23199_c0_seq1/g.37685  ORF comp23199_c0_seq1/g.37685 comp23199_c0_seq1/m.37685 type:complete len:417 (+) comp23199_c0_seq1:937-2187(+)